MKITNKRDVPGVGTVLTVEEYGGKPEEGIFDGDIPYRIVGRVQDAHCSCGYHRRLMHFIVEEI